MKITNTEHFGIQRKIVANMTTESWKNIPHVAYNYETDVTAFMEEAKQLNLHRNEEDKITFNTLMLKVICEGLAAAPRMNAHIRFNRLFVTGRMDMLENIDISMPMLLPNGEMMTINLRDFGAKNLDEMNAYISDVRRRLQRTNLNEAMYHVALDNTLTGLRQGKLLQTLCRLTGAKIGKGKVALLSGKERRDYAAIPESERITKRDLEPGSVTISNIGSLYRTQTGNAQLLEIIPPQVSAFAVGAVQERPAVVTDAFGQKDIAIRQILPICIAFDHRALDFGDVVPFLKRLDEIFANPAVIHTWSGKRGSHLREVSSRSRFAAEHLPPPKSTICF